MDPETSTAYRGKWSEQLVSIAEDHPTNIRLDSENSRIGHSDKERAAAQGMRTALIDAYRLIAAAERVEIQVPPDLELCRISRDLLLAITRASRCRMRSVALRGLWWREDNGPLLAFIADDQRPVALLPAKAGRYTLHDPSTGINIMVTSEVAASLAPFAYMIYRGFPDRSLTLMELVRFSLRGCGRDIQTLLMLGSAAGALGMLPAIATGLIVDNIIPAGERSQLLPLAAMLITGVLAAAIFQFGRANAMLRLETRANGAIQAALWDRLLHLPASFFRNYTTGDLAARALGIETIREILTGTVTSSFLAAIFSVFNLALMFYYSAQMATLATVLLLVTIAITSSSSLAQLRYEKELSEVQGKVSGTVLQLVNGLDKLRTAGAESRAFALWAHQFARQRWLAFRARRIAIHLTVFNAAFSVVIPLTIYGTLYLLGGNGLSAGAFLGFSSSLGVCVAAVLELNATVSSVLRVVTLYERARPILQARPEVRATKSHVGQLQGQVRLDHVSFRYSEDGPLILDDVLLLARPGEFVAIVGPSGSGKSTLFRLLLGFESPEDGSVYYDGQDLARLDVQMLRQQIGTVMQNSRVMPGDIFENIVGSAPCTIEEAWRAAAMAGLDEDIRSMPMGMHTIVGEGGMTFSGGQRQRLVIARALVRKPRILLFDEATSALDNRTQAIVSRSLASLKATRIVIAHRLSTIVGADRIYAFDRGRVVQCGTFDELCSQDGLFRDMMRRQII